MCIRDRYRAGPRTRYRAAQPRTTRPVSYTHLVEVAEARRTTLPNGIGLYTLASDDFEVLRISFVFRAGSALQQAPFSASAAANLLSEGSRDMTAHQIAEQLDYYEMCIRDRFTS